MPSLVGVDSYTYHRLLGEVRPGEMPPLHRFPRGSLDVVAEARRLELDFALLQTAFLGEPACFSPDGYRAEAGGVTLGLSWGAPEGLEFGERADGLESLLAWLPHARALGLPVMRIVAGGPAHRGQPLGPVAALLREACDGQGTTTFDSRSRTTAISPPSRSSSCSRRWETIFASASTRPTPFGSETTWRRWHGASRRRSRSCT